MDGAIFVSCFRNTVTGAFRKSSKKKNIPVVVRQTRLADLAGFSGEHRTDRAPQLWLKAVEVRRRCINPARRTPTLTVVETSEF